MQYAVRRRDWPVVERQGNTDHVSCIRLKKPTPIGLHFNQAGHGLKHFTILAIEQFEENSESIRHNKESTWQHLLQTAHPLGINNLKPRFFSTVIYS